MDEADVDIGGVSANFSFLAFAFVAAFIEGAEHIDGAFDAIDHDEGGFTVLVFVSDERRDVGGFCCFVLSFDSFGDVPEAAVSHTCGYANGFFVELSGSIDVVDGFQPIWLKCGAHPPRKARAEGSVISFGILGSECGQLGARGQACIHELHFVEDPEGILVEEAEIEGPACASDGVSAIESAGQEHVLCADEDGGFFRVELPANVLRAAHEDVGVDGGGDVLAPGIDDAGGLFDEDAHGQTQDEARGPLGIVEAHAMMEPREDGAGSFTEAGGYAQESVTTNGIGAEGGLPWMRGVSGEGLEEGVEVGHGFGLHEGLEVCR